MILSVTPNTCINIPPCGFHRLKYENTGDKEKILIVHIMTSVTYSYRHITPIYYYSETCLNRPS